MHVMPGKSYPDCIHKNDKNHQNLNNRVLFFRINKVKYEEVTTKLLKDSLLHLYVAVMVGLIGVSVFVYVCLCLRFCLCMCMCVCVCV